MIEPEHSIRISNILPLVISQTNSFKSSLLGLAIKSEPIHKASFNLSSFISIATIFDLELFLTPTSALIPIPPKPEIPINFAFFIFSSVIVIP